MNNTEEINIKWEGPFSIDEIIEDKIDSSKYSVKSNSIGLYQIYGTHPLYGDGVLVYIGKTKDKNGFRSRLTNRWVIKNGNDVENVKIYLGTILCDSSNLMEVKIKDYIDKSEILLINAMKPAFNSSNIQSVKEELIDNRFIVYNRGAYRSLYPILESNYFWKNYKNFLKVNEIATRLNITVYENAYCYGLDFNEKFEFKSDYEIWLGVDYDIWDAKNIPLTLEVYSEKDEMMKNLSKLDSFDIYTYEDNGEKTLYYKSIDVEDKTLNLEKEINLLIEEIKQKIQ